MILKNRYKHKHTRKYTMAAKALTSNETDICKLVFGSGKGYSHP